MKGKINNHKFVCVCAMSMGKEKGRDKLGVWD